MKQTIKINKYIETGGDGLWSDEQRKVKITELYFDNFDMSGFGDFNVYFDTKTWNTNKHGLIYTDRKFLKEFRALLQKKGFSKKAADDVDYTEQGMQGDDYVSMQFGKHLLKEWLQK